MRSEPPKGEVMARGPGAILSSHFSEKRAREKRDENNDAGPEESCERSAGRDRSFDWIYGLLGLQRSFLSTAEDMDGRSLGDGKRAESVPHRGYRHGVLSGSPPACGDAAYAGAGGRDLRHDRGLRAVPGARAFGGVPKSERGDTVVWCG